MCIRDRLLGLGNKAPTLGRISEVGSDYLVYEAYPDSSGTDTFSYAVEAVSYTHLDVYKRQTWNSAASRAACVVEVS